MDELKRMKRVLNMMISMHSSLRDKYHRLSQTLNLTLFMSAIILNSLVFASSEHLMKLPLFNKNIELIIGLTSIVVFFVSILMLIVKWDQKSGNHEEAKNQLSHLLNECREMFNHPEKISDMQVIQYSKKYSQINSMLIAIPEGSFNRLKYKHLQKMALSKYISDHHKSPYIITRLRFLLDSLRG